MEWITFAVAALALAVSVGTAIVVEAREFRRDRTDVQLAFLSSKGEVLVACGSAQPVTGVSLLFAGPNISFGNWGYNVLAPERTESLHVASDVPFTVYLSWIDRRGHIRRKRYRFDPTLKATQGDLYPDTHRVLEEAIARGLTRSQVLSRIDALGKWQDVPHALPKRARK